MVMNVFMVSLPKMAVDFGVPYSLAQTAITAYLLATSVAQLFLGPLSDRYGRRPIALVGFAIFTMASIGAAVAQDFTTFMVFRLMQCGVVAGLVVSRAAVRDMVSGDKAASMIAYVTMGMSVVPMIAPTIGGFLDGAFGWRATFGMMAVLGALTLVYVYFDMGETKHNRSGSMLAQFKRYPDLLRSRRFWGYTFILTFSSGMFFSYLSGGPYLGEHHFGLDGARFGLYLGFAPLGYFFGNWLSGRYATRLGIRRLVISGLLIGTSGMALALIPAWMGSTNPLSFFGFTAFIGFGNGMVIPSANAGMLEARPDLAGSASGLSGAIMTMGGALLAQIAGTLVERFDNVETMIYIILASSALAGLFAFWTFRVEILRENEAK